MSEQTNLDFKTLLLFYPNIDKCSFQFFMDDKNKKDVTKSKIAPIWYRIDGKTEDKAYSRLKYMNDNGCWIFFSINWMENGKRDKKSVTTINAWACECDNMDKEVQWAKIEKCPIKPSMIVESKHSLHMYRFAKDWTKENWSKICWGLRNYFDWDPAIASDISRVLRMPWFYNCKPKKEEWDSEEPFLCKIVKVDNTYYTEEEMFKAYNDTRTKSDIEFDNFIKNLCVKDKNKKNVVADDNFRYVVNDMDVVTMLSRISWTKWVAWEHITFKAMTWGRLRICCNGKDTNWWIDSMWKIWSTCWWWPWWIRRIQWYENNKGMKIDFKEMYQELIKDFPELKAMKDKNKHSWKSKREQTSKTKSILDLIAEEQNGYKG